MCDLVSPELDTDHRCRREVLFATCIFVLHNDSVILLQVLLTYRAFTENIPLFRSNIPSSNHNNYMKLPNLRKIFASFRTEEEEREVSRTAFFNLIGFLGSCVVFSLIAQKYSAKQLL